MIKYRNTAHKIALAGLFIALSYLGVKINIPVNIAGGKTMFHFGNTFCLLASLLLGGGLGGTAGAAGMALFDFTSEGYQLYVPQTLILKFIIGLITGAVYKKLKLMKNENFRVIVSCSAGMLFNIVFDPVASFFTSKYLFGANKGFASIIMKWSALTTFTNAILAVLIAALLYKALKTALITMKTK